MHTPNTVFFVITPAGNLGTVVLFLDRTTGQKIDDTILGLPPEFRATQLMILGSANTPAFFYSTDLSVAEATHALIAAGFVAHHSIGGPPPQKAPTNWSSPPPPALMAPADLFFSVRTRMVGPDGTTPQVTVVLYDKAAAQEEIAEGNTVQAETVKPSDTTLGAGPLLRPIPNEHWSATTALSAEDTTQALCALGAEPLPAPDHMLAPHELEFEAWVDEDGTTTLFMLPKDKNHPHSDNLSQDLLLVCPDWINDNLMENTWAISGKTPEEVRAALIVLGYTRNPAHQHYW